MAGEEGEGGVGAAVGGVAVEQLFGELEPGCSVVGEGAGELVGVGAAAGGGEGAGGDGEGAECHAGAVGGLEGCVLWWV